MRNKERLDRKWLDLIKAYPQYEQFSSSSIDVKVFFWTRHLRDSYATRSDLIMAITASFRSNGIVIPFPQQDVYLHRPESPRGISEIE